MKKIIIFHIITCCISLGFSFDQIRNDRMFSLFNVVKFKNSECQATSSAQLQGVCYTEEECSSKGGVSDGNCAAGFGVCCVFKVNTCPGTVSQNGSFVENPGFPDAQAEAVTCVVEVTRMQDDICQIRLDFTQTLLDAPVPATGVCAADTLVLAPGATNLVAQSTPPNLCGMLTGQHLYMDAGTANVAATLTFTIGAATTQKWRVKVSQIECSSRCKAPSGCLQYFTGMRSTVTSFNFDGNSDCTPTCNLGPQDYTVCFRKEKGMCGIQFMETTLATGDSFQLNGNVIATAVQTAANCANGFIQITGVPQATFAATNGIFCEGILATVAAAAQTNIIPSSSFRLRHFSDNMQNTLAGFSVDATQTPC